MIQQHSRGFLKTNMEKRMVKKELIIKTLWKIISTILFFPLAVAAQQNRNDSIIQTATITNCVHYAIAHNPDLKNAQLNESITEQSIKIKLSEWLPQVNLNYAVQHNFQLPVANFNGSVINTGSANTSGFEFGATQNIFSSDLLLASRSASDVRLQARENTRAQNINIAVLVSKAFYDVLLTKQQLDVTDEDIARTESSLKDAFNQYQAGITDKTDYKRAMISLNNAKAQRKFNIENIKAKYIYLKQLMGYPATKDFQLVYDSAQMRQEIFVDTLQQVSYANRIEVQQLETQKKLQQYNLQYYRWNFLPTISAFGNYNLNYLNSKFTKLYGQSYPNSYAGVLLSIPIFQGGKRLFQIRQAELQVQQVGNSITSSENTINTQYAQALATYKSNFFDYNILKENLSLAAEVYNVIQLQYKAGIKAYIEVINAESDLLTAQINYYNALYQVLSSKIDVAQSLGIVQY